MKKSIIISGPAGSGKSHIAEAILSTHKKGTKVTCNYKDLLHDLRSHPAGKLQNAFFAINILVVDECPDLADIKYMHSKAQSSLGSSAPHLIFLTQRKLEHDPSGNKRFHIINLYK